MFGKYRRIFIQAKPYDVRSYDCRNQWAGPRFIPFIKILREFGGILRIAFKRLSRVDEPAVGDLSTARVPIRYSSV